MEYEAIYKAIDYLGHKNLSRAAIDIDPKEHYALPYSKVVAHYKRVVKWIKAADVIVVEGSTASMAMGSILQKAIDESKCSIVLHTPSNIPFFLNAMQNERALILEYTKLSVVKVLKNAFEYLEEKQESRFTMILDADIKNWLNEVTKKGISRSEYIRNLIIRDKNKKSK